MRILITSRRKFTRSYREGGGEFDRGLHKGSSPAVYAKQIVGKEALGEGITSAKTTKTGLEGGRNGHLGDINKKMPFWK